MCGIYGCVGTGYSQIESVFGRDLRHRGPDDNGFYKDEDAKIALGHVRLSIIDLSTNAHQPMSSRDGRYTIVFNGEIYNHLELREELKQTGVDFLSASDTEVVLQGYIAWGYKCLEKLRGMFAFAIYDNRTRELLLARDRFGIKPLIYSFLNEKFVFSSELKPLLKSDLIPKKLSYEAVNDFFRYGSVKQPKTILEGVYHLMPGHAMTVQMDRSHTVSEYYNFVQESLSRPQITDYNEAVKAVREELEVATRYHMVADVEVGAFLSGGVDSSAVVALMQRCSETSINTFCVGFKDRTNVIDETDVAERTARFLGTNHHTIKIDDIYISEIIDDFIESLDQPSIDGINTYVVSRETAKDLKVALSGLGGDELFAGYPHYASILNSIYMKNNSLEKFGRWINRKRPNRFTNKYRFAGMTEEEALEGQRKIIDNLDYVLLKIEEKEKISHDKRLSSIQKLSAEEVGGYMLNTLLRDNDVLSMASSLEVRPILLDHKLAELAFSLADNFKIRDNRLKAVFVDSVKDIVPNEVWQRKKSGFEMPFASWMNGKLNGKFLEMVCGNKASCVFTQSYLKNLKKRINSKNIKRSDWISFVFLSWLEKFEVEV